jgi:hypothetical protein
MKTGKQPKNKTQAPTQQPQVMKKSKEEIVIGEEKKNSSSKKSVDSTDNEMNFDKGSNHSHKPKATIKAE